MKFIWAVTAVCLLLFCADRIVRDNPYDPDNSGGDYAAAASFKSSTDILYASYPCTLLCVDKGKNSYRNFNVQTDLPVLTKDSRKETDEHGMGVIRFGTIGKCKVTVYGVRQNRVIDSIMTLPLTVVNPFVIEVDSASLLLGHSVKFSVRNIHRPSDKDLSLVVKWYKAGLHSGNRTMLPFDSSFTVSPDAIPDTLSVSAMVTDTFGCVIQMDTVHVPVPARHFPFVNILKSHLFPPVNIPYILEALVKDADSLIWKMSTTVSDTTITTGTPILERTWDDTLQTVVVVTAKNRFNTIGISDTITVKPKKYAYGFREPLQKRLILAGLWEEWSVVATENGLPATDTTINYLWNVEPQFSGMVKPSGNRIRILVNENIPSFTLSVVASGKYGSSFEMFQTITVVNHAPLLSTLSSKDSLHIDDSTELTIATRDVNSGGSIGAVFYRLAGDTTVNTIAGNSLVLSFKKPGWQHVYLWCIDNDKFSSDTLDKAIYVWTDLPFFERQSIDTVIYVNSQFRIPAYAETRRNSDHVVQWLWFNDTSTVPARSTQEPFIDTTFSEAITHHFWVKCVSQLGDTSKSLPISIRVSLGYPVVKMARISSKDSVFINDELLVSFSASDSSGMLSQIRLFANDTPFDTMVIDPKSSVYSDTILQHAPVSPGKYLFSIAAVDDDNYMSSKVFFGDSIEVLPGIPLIESFSPDSCWAKDSIQFTIGAHDYNADGAVKTYHVRWHSDSNFVTYADPVLMRRYFPDTGAVYVTCYVVDDDGVSSAHLHDTLQVRPAIARVASIATVPAGGDIFINDTVNFTVALTDPNDSVLTLGVSLTGDDAPEFSFKDTSGLVITFPYAFGKDSTENREIKLRVTDSDANRFDTIFRFTVKNGPPSVTSVDFDTTADNVFVNDARVFTVKAEDENGYIRKLFVNWNGGLQAMDSITAPEQAKAHTGTFTHTYQPGEAGNVSARFWASDEDGVVSVVKKKDFLLRKGVPLVTAAWCDSAKIWVNDNYRYHVSATDTNGVIRKVYADWNSDFAVDESLDVTGSRSSVDTFFTHAYDTTLAGSRTPRFSAGDEDGVVSLTRDTTVVVDLGAPVLWGDSGDTLWLAVNNGGGFYPYRPHYSDPNGIIDTFYFGNDYENLSLAIKKFREDSNTQWLEDGLYNKSRDRWVWIKDDDGLLRGKKFKIYSDSAPPAPLGLNKEQTSDSVQIQWDSTSLDFKDQIATQVKILIRYGNIGDPDSVIMDWTDASALPVGGTGTAYPYRYFTFKKEYTGPIRYRIVLRDKRGTVSMSEVAPATIN